MMSASDCTNPEVFRPSSSYWILAGLYFFLIGISASEWYSGSEYHAIDATLWSIFLIILFALGIGRPKVIFFDEGLTIVNPIDSYTLSWEDVEGVEAGLTLLIFTADRKINAWAATGPSRRKVRRSMKVNKGSKVSELQGVNPKHLGLERGSRITPNDLPDTDSGAAAAIARYRLKEFSRFGNKTRIPQTTRRNYLMIGIDAVIGISALILIVIHP
jgi:hypothetical protein